MDEQQELEDEAADTRDTLANNLVRALEARGAVWLAPANAAPLPSHPPGAVADELVAQVAKEWCARAAQAELEDVKDALRLVLATNPRVRRDPRRPEAVLAAARRTRSAALDGATQTNGGGGAAPSSTRGEWKRRRGKGEEGDDDDEANHEHDDDDEAPRGRSGSRRVQRGAAGGGKGAAGGGERGAGGTTNKRREGNAREKEKEKEKEEKNPWIQCDGCHKWVQARMDNIEDISLYDDANPDHLDYYCPRCRKKRADTAGPGAAAAAAVVGGGDDGSESVVTATRGARAKPKRSRSGADVEAGDADALPDAAPVTRRSTRAKGGRKRAAEEVEEEDDEAEAEADDGGRLESVERALLDEWEAEKRTRAATLEGEPERLASVRALERKFEEEAAKYKSTLLGHRNAAWERNARDADAGDVELLDDKAEEELALQYRDWWEKRRTRLRSLIDSAPDT